jgi:hypothetical protein
MNQQIIEGYICTKYPSMRLFIRDDLVSLCTPSKWQNFCYSLLREQQNHTLHKETTYKSIFTLRFPLTAEGTPCLVKKFKNKGIIKLVKSMFRPSPAFHELQTALHIHKKGIPAIAPLLIAEFTKYYCITQSLQLLPFLENARELKDIFLNPDFAHTPYCSTAERWRIVKSFGRLTAKIFQSGIYQNDYSLNNFMIKKEFIGHRIYLIDFERTELLDSLSETHKLELLAKLNRVGCEISIKDRLRFLSAYRETEKNSGKTLKIRAREVQAATLAMLKRDLQRRRLTSVYTSEQYEKFTVDGYRGMFRVGYAIPEIIHKLADITPDETHIPFTLKFNATVHTLKALQFKRNEAEDLWAIINNLKLAGLPLEMPHILAESDTSSFLFFLVPQPATVTSLDTLKQKTGTTALKVFEKHFPEELERIGALLQTLGQ